MKYSSFFSLVLTFFAFSVSSAQASPVLEKIQSVVAKPEILCGQFDQKKTLVGVKAPLNSNGRFCVHTGKGVLWRTLKPFPNTIRLTRNEITQWQGNKVTMKMDAKREPAIQMINSVLFSLISGDLSQLETLFKTDAHIQGSKWDVNLKARDPGLLKVIEKISLSGGAYVKNIVIHETNGDRTHIAFSDIQTGKAAMSSSEAALYE